MSKADIIIIGAGPGGYEMAALAAENGKTVVLVERDQLGGTCLNRGCIPTKALCASAAVVGTVREAAAWGVTTGEVTADFSVAASRKDAVVAQLRDGVAMLLNKPEITIARGEAEMVDAHTVKVGEETYTAPNVVIATGSEPRDLPITGAELAVSSDDILSLTSLPKSLCIIGGGVIGMEFAAIFNSYGVEVTVIEFCKEILPPFDKDIAKRLKQSLSRRGVNIITQGAVNAIERTDSGTLMLSYDHKGKPKTVEAEMALMSVGRAPVLPAGLDKTGVAVERRGISVNEHMMTNVEGVYAIGDVNGLCMLAHAATAQGKVALDHILGRESAIRLDVVPSAVFTTPELAMVGLTEQQCEDKGLEPLVKKVFFRANGKAVAMGESDGLLKMIVDPSTRRVLGCHICGPHAADLIQEVATVMSLDASVDAIANAIHGHPTLSEVTAAAAVI